MIKKFKCKETEKIFNMEASNVLPKDIQQRAYNKLRMIHNAATIYDLRIPLSNSLEKLKKDRTGQHSIRINNQWRICFRWANGDAHDVEIVDYH
jgi:proteic killer suppression protein